MSNEQYRKHLVAEARILQLSEHNPDLHLWPDADLHECITLFTIANLDLPSNTVFTEDQLERLVDHLYPERVTAPGQV